MYAPSALAFVHISFSDLWREALTAKSSAALLPAARPVPCLKLWRDVLPGVHYTGNETSLEDAPMQMLWADDNRQEMAEDDMFDDLEDYDAGHTDDYEQIEI